MDNSPAFAIFLNIANEAGDISVRSVGAATVFTRSSSLGNRDITLNYVPADEQIKDSGYLGLFSAYGGSERVVDCKTFSDAATMAGLFIAFLVDWLDLEHFEELRRR